MRYSGMRFLVREPTSWQKHCTKLLSSAIRTNIRLLLNLKYLPSSQKSMMLKVFRMELEGLQQIESDEESAADPLQSIQDKCYPVSSGYLQIF